MSQLAVGRERGQLFFGAFPRERPLTQNHGWLCARPVMMAKARERQRMVHGGTLRKIRVWNRMAKDR